MTHNYAGLSPGNVASQSNAGRISRPRAAALQGLAKMEAIAAMGLPQCFLPPHERPAIWALRRHGFTGDEAQVLARAHAERPHVLAQCSSSSFMWTANAATAAPGGADQPTRLVVANLRSMPHRAIEPPCTRTILAAALPDHARHSVHAALPDDPDLGDEGAANHTLLFDPADPTRTAVHLFVYGVDAARPESRPRVHPARQTLQASRRVAALLGLDDRHCVFVQQHPDAIDQGVFHNDVAAVGNANALLVHEDAWLDGGRAMDAIAARVGPAFRPIVVRREELTIAEAVATYLFNSQLLSTPDGGMALVCPVEVRDHARAQAVCRRIVADEGNPVRRVLYLDVRESMRNGGGPACLRLRVPIGDDGLTGVHPGCVLTPPRAAALRAWIERWYPEELAPEDLADPALLARNREALDSLVRLLGLPAIYPFQGVSPEAPRA